MKRTLAVGCTAVAALAGTASALADHKPGHPAKSKPAKANANAQKGKAAKIQICHRTLSETNPHRTLRISERAWRAHEAHGDARGACDGDAEPVGTTALATTLAAVSGATGSGSFHADVRRPKNGRARLCYTLTTTGVDATAAHIHTAVAQDFAGTDYAANAIVVPLKTPNAAGLARGCATVPADVATDIRTNPGEYYVNVHSAAFPNGQVQGTLATA
jgi:hypothetical protein